MSTKIPVGATIGGAYRFAFGRFFAVIGVVWLPLALTVAAIYFLFRDVAVPAFGATAQEAYYNWLAFQASLMGPLYAVQLVLWVAAIMIEVGLTRLALGIGGTPIVFFSLGAPFWRMLGANLILVAIFLIVLIPVMLLFFAFGGVIGVLVQGGGAAQGAWVDPTVAPWLAVALIVLAIIAFIGVYYVYLRLWFFLAPVVIAEKHIDLRPGWRMAKGNVLRIFVILIAVTLPPVMLLVAAEAIALFLMLSHSWTTLPDATFFAERWVEFTVLGVVALIGWVLAVAALNGARAIAYRLLVPAEAAGEP